MQSDITLQQRLTDTFTNGLQMTSLKVHHKWNSSVLWAETKWAVLGGRKFKNLE